MQTNQRHPAPAVQYGSSVTVSDTAAAKVLDGILCKPNGRRGATSPKTQNKRKMIGFGVCKPSEAIVACLRDNGLVEDFVSALRVLLNPGAVTSTLLIADVARAVTRAERGIAQPIEELFSNRASSRDYAAICRGAHELEEEAEQLSELAARHQYVVPIRASA